MPRGRSHTKPGSLLKYQIPIRPWGDRDEAVPGFVEIDLVGHKGGNGSGEFCFTLTETDNRHRDLVDGEPGGAQQSSTTGLRGGTEFINAQLLRWCIEETITFRRSPPGTKTTAEDDPRLPEVMTWDNRAIHASATRPETGVSVGSVTARLDRLPKIGAPATQGLAAAGFTELRQLVGVPTDELAGLHGVGPRALRIIREELQAITRHHDEGEVVYVDARPTDYELRVVEPEATWPQHYDELAAAVARTLGDRVVEIHHVGSTSVAGLPAKPIIDVDLVVADPADEAAYVPDLQALGLVHWLTEPDWHQHRLFKGLTREQHEPRVHVHVFGPGCPEVVRHLMFRDWLRTHPEDRERYAAAKREALVALDATGAEHGALGSGMRYNAFKEPVVHEIYDAMFRAAGLPRR